MEILQLRVEKALDTARVDEVALKKIAGYKSRETGDPRKAVELVASAVRGAEGSGGRLPEKQVDVAEHTLEMDKKEELIRAMASQQRLALQVCYALLLKTRGKVFTGEAYEAYKNLCFREQLRPLRQRRFSDIIGLLDLYGLNNSRIISKGRYGNTRQISGWLPDGVAKRFLGSKPV